MTRRGGGSSSSRRLPQQQTSGGSSSHNKTAPVALPHDGPIHAAWHQLVSHTAQAAAAAAAVAATTTAAAAATTTTATTKTTTTTTTEEEEYDRAVSLAAQLLMHPNPSSSSSTIEITLLSTPTNSTIAYSSLLAALCPTPGCCCSSRPHTLQDQLQALQAHRSQLLQHQQHQHLLEGCDAAEDCWRNATAPTTPTLLQDLILWEWMLSAHTPVAVRRAIASCLAASSFRPRVGGDGSNATTTTRDDEDEDDTNNTAASLDATHNNNKDINTITITTTRTRLILQVVESILRSNDFADDDDGKDHDNDAMHHSSTNINQNSNCWSRPLHSLQEALSWAPLEDYLLQTEHHQHQEASSSSPVGLLTRVALFLQRHGRTATLSLSAVENATTTRAERSDDSHHRETIVGLANLMDRVIWTRFLSQQQQSRSSSSSGRSGGTRDDPRGGDPEPVSVVRMAPCHVWNDCIESFRTFLWTVLTTKHPDLSVDCWSSIGIAFGHTVQWQHQQQQEFFDGHRDKIDGCASSPIETTTTTTIETTMASSSSDIFREILDQLRDETTMSDLCQAAVLQGLAAVVPFTNNEEENGLDVVPELMSAIRDLILQASDPDVRLSALKSIRSLISRLQTIYDDAQNQKSRTVNDFDAPWVHPLMIETLEIVLQAWENPPTRKLANAIPPLFDSLIQILLVLNPRSSLPVTEYNNDECSGKDRILNDLVQRLLSQPLHRKGRYLALQAVLPITGASQLVYRSSSLLPELLEGIADHGHNTGVIANLWVQLLRSLWLEKCECSSRQESPHPQENQTKQKSSLPTTYLQEWLDIWVPSLVSSLVSIEVSRRKQVAAFCLPRLTSMVDPQAATNSGGKPATLNHIFIALLLAVSKFRPHKEQCRQYEPISQDRETLSDRILWAELEVIQFASKEGLLQSTDDTNSLCKLVASLTPRDVLRSALAHSSPIISVAALKVMEYIVPTLDNFQMSSLENLKQEIVLWTFSLPLLVKTDGKEYISSILKCLVSFLDRLSLAEATATETASNIASTSISKSMFVEFAGSFLVSDIMVVKCGYPGTVALKESFVLSLLDCIVAYSSRDHPLALESKLMPKSSALFRRRRLDSENASLLTIKKELLSQEVFASLFSLLHSIWDNTRANAYRALDNLVQLAGMSSLALPDVYVNLKRQQWIESRGVYLATSPRQREADTGARILAFLFMSTSSSSAKVALLARLVELLGRKVLQMKTKLAAILSQDVNILDGRQLPLAHGLIHATRLIIENAALTYMLQDTVSAEELKLLLGHLLGYLFQAIRVSLAVVADVSSGEMVEGMDEEMMLSLSVEAHASSKTINPGAIGANGIFSSVNRVTDEDAANLQASQRIVVGSWLLTKETCGAVAALLSLKGYNAELDTFKEAGKLLISTLTSLKHTGAAFAAHRAIQTLAWVCLQKPKRIPDNQLPFMWATRLLSEVSKCNKIRDSTLRRSTGYTLGFVALMRADVACNTKNTLCHHIMASMFKFCLPSQTQAAEFTKKLDLSKDNKRLLFLFIEEQHELVSDGCYDIRTRVHALNILRSVLLDAPLSRTVFPFVGAAIIASVVGYIDSEWSVRNSSTMVFAAAMVRSIDSDQNSSNKDATSSKARSLHELCLAYPILSPFLISVLECSIKGIFSEQTTGTSLPPALPILLLLTRVQPVAQSGQDSVSRAEPFINAVLQCLDSKHISIRNGAARALRNLSSEVRTSSTSIRSILQYCLQTISMTTNSKAGDHWNRLHGALLTFCELVKYSSVACELAHDENTIKNLHHLCTIDEDLPLVPAPCLMIVIDVLEFLTTKHVEINTVRICDKITAWLEETNDSSVCRIGEAELAVRVTAVSMNEITSCIWDHTVGMEEKTIYLDRLSSKICSGRIDIRLTAVKTLKKGIYDGIDRMIAEGCNEVILAVAKILVLAINTELDRNRTNDLSPNGQSHPPTLRRLTRSLLECIESGSSSWIFEENCEFLLACRDTSSILLDQSHLIDQKIDTDSLTFLDGYIVELLSFMGLHTSENQSFRDLNFSSCILKLSSPSCHWRIRYSAAIALKRYSWNRYNENDRDAAPEIHDNHFELVQAWLKLMQDDDLDVRYAATKADCDCRNISVYTMISELFLLQSFDSLRGSVSMQRWSGFLLSHLLQHSDALTMQIESALFEYSHSRLDGASESISGHDGLGRKIFESEKPNSYNEISFVGQLVVLELSRMAQKYSGNLIDDFLRERVERLFERIQHALIMIKSSMFGPLQLATPTKDIAHDITRNNAVFPSLHCLLLGGIVAIYLGTEKFSTRDSALTVANEIYSSVHENSTIHPYIRQSLETLIVAKKWSKETLDSLRDCCFLIPKTMWLCNDPPLDHR